MIFPGFPGVLSVFQVFQVEWEPCTTRDQKREWTGIYAANFGGHQRRIQDFPWGAPTPQGGRQHTILPNFPENCMKSKEFGCPRGRGVHAPCAPPKSATGHLLYNLIIYAQGACPPQPLLPPPPPPPSRSASDI